MPFLPLQCHPRLKRNPRRRLQKELERFLLHHLGYPTRPWWCRLNITVSSSARKAGHDIVLRHLIIIRLKRRRDRHYSLPIQQEGYLYVGAGSLPFIL